MQLHVSKVTKILIASTLVSGIVSASGLEARSEVMMRFTAPFISNAGTLDAAGDRHFLTINVTGLPLESLIVTLPESMKFDEAVVINQSGQEIRTSQTLQNGILLLHFDQAVQPDSRLRVRLTGAETETPGNRLLYRIAAITSGLDTPVPLGTAMIRLPDVDL